MRWYRGTDGSDGRIDGPRWYARSSEYAEFYGHAIEEIEIGTGEILDLREYGLGDEDTVIDAALGLPPYRPGLDAEMYAYAERKDVQEAALRLGYRAIRVLQWHADYGSEPQDSLLVLATTAPEDEVNALLPTA